MEAGKWLYVYDHKNLKYLSWQSLDFWIYFIWVMFQLISYSYILEMLYINKKINSHCDEKFCI